MLTGAAGRAKTAPQHPAVRLHSWLFAGAMVILLGMAAVTAAAASPAQAPAQQAFPSPQLAVSALARAVLDDNAAELLAILGPDAEDLVFSGDPVADRNGRARFLSAYTEQNRLVLQGEDRALLIVGIEAYTLPIPLVRQGTAWRFDASAGREEILTRRIGRNELHTIAVMQAYTAAQREYACRQRDGAGREFAQRFASTPGQRDGLYWEPAEGEPASPLGPLIALATEEGYRNGLGDDAPEPFYGYYFRILKAQGAHATGGAFPYVANGKMALGFALVAYPARYGASGVMTFIVNQAGVIYEKDLGTDTAALAAAMIAYDPDESWRRYQGPDAP